MTSLPRIVKPSLAAAVAALALGMAWRAQAAVVPEGPREAPDPVLEESAGRSAGDEDAEIEERHEDRVLPFSMSPRIGKALVTNHVWAGYDGSARRAVGEAVAEVRVARSVALRAGATSADFWGNPTAIFGLRVALLRENPAPFALALGAAYLPQTIHGDGLLFGTVSLGKTFGRWSSVVTLGYGQDPEGDDRMGAASVAGICELRERLHLGIDGRTRFQLGSEDVKFDARMDPMLDFAVGPNLAYSLGVFDVAAHVGVAGVVQSGGGSGVRVGPLALLSVGAAL